MLIGASNKFQSTVISSLPGNDTRTLFYIGAGKSYSVNHKPPQRDFATGYSHRTSHSLDLSIVRYI